MKVVTIHTIPTLPSIDLPATIATPDLTMPAPITVTPEETDYYADACDSHLSAEYSEQELAELFPGLSQSNACEWAIIGFTVQDWLTVESKLALAGTYSQQLRDRIELLEGIIHDLVEAGEKQEEAIGDIE